MHPVFIILIWLTFEILVMYFGVIKKTNKDQLKASCIYAGTFHPSFFKKPKLWFVIQLIISLIITTFFIVVSFIKDLN